MTMKTLTGETSATHVFFGNNSIVLVVDDDSSELVELF